MAKKLNFNSTDADTLAASDFVGSHLYAGGVRLTQTQVGAKEALDVNVANAIDVALDGVYDGVNNTNPDNVGLIAHARGATPADADQTFRSTGGAASSDNVVAANVHGLDTNSFGMLYDGTTWDRARGTAGAANVHLTSQESGFTVGVSDAALANTAVLATAASVTTTSAALLGSQLAARKYLFLYNAGSKVVDIGPSGVASGSGFPIYPGVYFEMRLGPAVSLHADAVSGTQDVRILEAS